MKFVKVVAAWKLDVDEKQKLAQEIDDCTGNQYCFRFHSASVKLKRIGVKK